MSLKKLRVKMTPAPAVKPGEIPTLMVEGDLVKQYITADRQKKEAEELMADLRPEIVDLGRGEVFRRSVGSPAHPTCTVKVQDEEAEVVSVQFTSAYSVVADVHAAEELFESVVNGDGKPVDINQFLQETVVAKFNCDVFHDPEGRFDQAVYNKFRQAIECVAAELKLNCPLETAKAVKPLPAFHTERWGVFPNKVLQAELEGANETLQDRFTRVIPNTTRIVPVTRKSVLRSP